MWLVKRRPFRLNRGQTVVEYMLFFAVIAVLTLLSLTAFFSNMREGCETAFEEAKAAMYR